MKWWPKFSITDLLWLTVAMALGFAVAGPVLRHPFGVPAGFVFDLRLPDALEATGCLLLLFSLVQHARLMCSLPRPDSKPEAFALQLRTTTCLVLAGMLGIMWGVRFVLNRQLIAPPKHTEYLHIWSALWPDLLVLVVAFAAMRLLTSTRHGGVDKRWWRTAIVVFVVIGGGVATMLKLTERSQLLLLVHVAISRVEAAHPAWLQRPGAFPDHVAEGFWSFWVSTLAAAGTVVGAVLLFLDSQLHRSRTRFVVRSALAATLIALTYFAWWFWNSEFPRIDPDMAIAGTAQHWSDTLGAILLLCGVAVGLAMQGARDECDGLKPLRLRAGGLLAVIGASLVALAAMWWLVIWMLGESSLAAGLAAHDLTYITQQVIERIMLMPESLLRLLVILSALALLWQSIRRPDATKPIPPISPGRFTYQLVAWTMLLTAGVTSLWAFSMCYWLGPFVI